MNAPSIARGKIELTIDRLNSKYPLHAGILAQWRLEESAEVGTVGVGFRDDRLRLVYSPGFVESIGMDELMGVLHHEVNHVLFGHVFHEPGEREDGQARTIAEEVTVNEWVPEPLPATPVLLEQYPFLPENESTEERYEKLWKRSKRSALAAPRGAPSRGVPSGSKQKSSNSVGAGSAQSSGTGQAKQNAQGGQGGAAPQRTGAQTGGNPQQAPRPTSNGVPTTDDHSIWAEVRNDKAQAEQAAKMDIALAWGNLNPEERAKVSNPFDAIAMAAAEEAGFDGIMAIGIGTEAGDREESLDAGQGRIPWQTVLRRHVGRLVELRPVFGRPPRRFPNMAGIIPGKGRFSQKPKVMAVIDTSGSMTVAMLEAISAELGLMAKRYDVLVVECDVQIHRTYPYRPIVSVMGRGGTDFRPPFEQGFLNEHCPDLVVYFTDGYGPVPARAPTIPVIWCIAEDGVEPAEWGTKIALSESKTGPDVPNFGPGAGIFGGATSGIGSTGSQDR